MGTSDTDDGVQRRSLAIDTPDGALLAATLFEPPEPARALVIVHSATGVPQGYYAAFANWAAAQRGVAVLTCDYRDSGQSQKGDLRASRVDMVDWGVGDTQAIRAAMRQRFAGLPQLVIGHSLGAMLTPMQRDFTDVARITAVASGIVHVSDHPWPYRAKALWFWYVIGPLATLIKGYLPGRALRFGEDLPAPVYWQWRRWCTRRVFHGPDLGTRMPHPEWDMQRPPVRLFAFEDDETIPPHCVEKLAQGFQGGRAEIIRIDPVQRGLGKVGHMGAFARRNSALWGDILGELPGTPVGVQR